MRRSMIVGLLILALLAVATPAWAQDAQGPEAFVVLSGRADVPEGQQVGDLVVFHGSATVDGTVDGSLTASVSTLVVGLVLVLLAGRGAGWILEAGRTQVGPAIGWGLLVFFGLPIMAIGALVTLVGIPLGLGLLAALGLIYALGYGASAWVLGRSLLRPPSAWVVAFLVGWAILRVVALVPILGGLIWFAAVVFGLGVLAVAIWRGRSAARAGPTTA